MPQMNPMNWTILYIMFSSIMLFTMSLNFFSQPINSMKIKNIHSMNTNKKINWK